MQIGPNTTFSQIHQALQPGVLGIGGDTHLRGDTAGTTLYAHSGLKAHGLGADAARARTQKYAYGAMVVRQAIDREYGPGTANRLFQNIRQQTGRDLDQGVRRKDLATIQQAITIEAAQRRAQRVQALTNGAQQVMTQLKPEWCKSSVASDGLPQKVSSVDARGSPLNEGEVGATNQFARLVRGEISALPVGAHMNCWEGVLTSAMAGGLLTLQDVRQMYQGTVGAQDRDRALLDGLGYSQAQDVDWEQVAPEPGDVIVVDKVGDDGREVGFHVMIAGDDGMVYSHDKSALARWNLIGPEPSSQCMVHTDMRPVMEYARDAIERQGGSIQVRYLKGLCG